jgi:hypothetical protein
LSSNSIHPLMARSLTFTFLSALLALPPAWFFQVSLSWW